MRGVKLHLIGERFGYVTVVASHAINLPGTWWVCRCDCGKTCFKAGRDLRNKKWNHSCGCMPALVKSIQLQNRGGIDRRLDYLHRSHRQ
jgi:hypothetical protein